MQNHQENNIKKPTPKILDWIKNNSIAVSLALCIGGGALLLYSNEYKPEAQTIAVVEKGQAIERQIYTYEKNKLYLDIISGILINLGISIFISAFFMRNIEKNERRQLEEKLLSFQRETGKNAIESIFKTLFDESFFDLIRKDLLDATCIRRKAHWQYDITCDTNDTLVLQRTISYEFHNMSQKKTTETIKLVSNNNIHCSTKIISAKSRRDDKEDHFNFSDQDTKPSTEHAFTDLKWDLDILPGEYIEVVLVFEQNFKSKNYIYECHTTAYPIIDLEITANFPKGYKFDLFSSFSNRERVRINEPTKKVFVISGAIFKGQGVEFICEKIPKAQEST